MYVNPEYTSVLRVPSSVMGSFCCLVFLSCYYHQLLTFIHSVNNCQAIWVYTKVNWACSEGNYTGVLPLLVKSDYILALSVLQGSEDKMKTHAKAL